jgi:hypothetical protein
MNIRLTDAQIEQVLEGLTKEQFIDFLETDINQSVDWICEFIHRNIDSAAHQEQVLKSFPHIQLELELWK